MNRPFVGQKFEAEVVWMDERPLDPGRVYLLKQGTRTVTAEINHPLMLNQIGRVEVTTARPLVFDRYTENRGTGSFILIDPATQFTCGAGMITDPVREGGSSGRRADVGRGTDREARPPRRVRRRGHRRRATRRSRRC